MSTLVDMFSLANMEYSVKIKPSTKPKKKYEAVIVSKDTDKIDTVHFGDKEYSDFTKSKDINKKRLYLLRHEKNEDWSIDGIKSAGFWARWILWNKTSIRKSIKDINRRFMNKVIVKM